MKTFLVRNSVVTLFARQNNTGHKAIIGQQQLSDTVRIVWRFSAHTRIVPIWPGEGAS